MTRANYNDPAQTEAASTMELAKQDERMSEVLTGVQLPLENVEYAIEQYLLANGTRLDNETRCLLAGVRDCVGRVAGSTREMVDRRRDRPHALTR